MSFSCFPHVVLKPGKELPLLKGHPWIFSGAISHIPSCIEGDVFPVYSFDGKFLAQAYFHPKSSIAGRVLSRTQAPIDEEIRQKLEKALRWRQSLGWEGCRLVNGEGDGIPGLIVDRYRDICVIQVNTWGIERWKPFLVQQLQAALAPRSILEKSVSTCRIQEGLSPAEGVLFGEAVEETSFSDGTVTWIVPFTWGQKTGFFLDQAEMRRLIRRYVRGQSVLNCFSYTGGFSLHALAAGALHVTSIDSSGPALALLEKQLILNRMNSDQHTSRQEDVFQFLSRSPTQKFDCVILDPPALVKTRKDLIAASKGYFYLHRRAFHYLEAGGILLTSSCSSYLTRDLFEKIVADAARDAGRSIQILSRHLLSPDHPISPSHPEGDYLKSLLIRVES